MIRIVEVGPRDGLQNEKISLDLDTRFEFVEKLVNAGLKVIEVGAFVSTEKIPQMAQSEKLTQKVISKFSETRVRFPVLVPNERGLEDALAAGAKEISIFTACSEKFNQANINCSIEESFERFEPVIQIAKKNKLKIRGYLSTCFYCPYEGKIKPKKVAELTKRLLKLGCFEVSIGDTLGAATPYEVRDVIELLRKEVKAGEVAMHFHDTRGTALSNILISLQMGIKTFDSSIGGLGGCPYAPGAQGNVATEDVVYMLHGMGFRTGIDIEELFKINKWLSQKINRDLPSRVGRALLPKYK